MTQNQIAYFNAKVQQEHYRRQDDETRRHNVRTEQLTGDTNTYTREHYERGDSESQRHNRASEQLSNAQNDVARFNAETNRLGAMETARHNQVSETQTWANINETKRHNLSSENISIANLSETSRHNRAQESIDSALASSTITRNTVLNYLTSAQELSEYQKQLNLSAESALKKEQSTTETKKQAQYDADVKLKNAQVITELFKQDELFSESRYQKVLAEQNLAGKTDSETFRNYTSGVSNITSAISDIAGIFNRSNTRSKGGASVNNTAVGALESVFASQPYYYDSNGQPLFSN